MLCACPACGARCLLAGVILSCHPVLRGCLIPASAPSPQGAAGSPLVGVALQICGIPTPTLSPAQAGYTTGSALEQGRGGLGPGIVRGLIAALHSPGAMAKLHRTACIVHDLFLLLVATVALADAQQRFYLWLLEAVCFIITKQRYESRERFLLWLLRVTVLPRCSLLDGCAIGQHACGVLSREPKGGAGLQVVPKVVQSPFGTGK